jgi:vacuolar iron transporter family protein
LLLAPVDRRPNEEMFSWFSSGSQTKEDSMYVAHAERHRTGRIGWLRAAVLGANDGIVSTSSLVLGVAAAHVTHSNVMVAGVAGLVAGAMSMAAGEYVSVHSQADTEQQNSSSSARNSRQTTRASTRN